MKIILEALCSMQFLFSPGRFLNGMSGRLECTDIGERGVLKNVNEMWSASSSPWFLGRQGGVYVGIRGMLVTVSEFGLGSGGSALRIRPRNPPRADPQHRPCPSGSETDSVPQATPKP